MSLTVLSTTVQYMHLKNSSVGHQWKEGEIVLGIADSIYRDEKHACSFRIMSVYE